MSHPIPEDAQLLISRLRALADEIASAARYGIPIPSIVSASGGRYGGASFAASETEFAPWAEYVEGDPEHYEYQGKRWARIEANVNGLRVEFATRLDSEAEAVS